MARNDPSVEDKRVPLSSLILGYGPMLPILLAAVLAWATWPPIPTIVTWLGIWWAAAILLFLAGVRRGLSFRGDDPPVFAGLATSMWLFVLGAGAFVAKTPPQSLILLVIGYLSVLILDPAAARRGEVPLHFLRVRPLQMSLALIGLIAMLVRVAEFSVPV